MHSTVGKIVDALKSENALLMNPNINPINKINAKFTQYATMSGISTKLSINAMNLRLPAFDR
jgi:hypothetical protein